MVFELVEARLTPGVCLPDRDRCVAPGQLSGLRPGHRGAQSSRLGRNGIFENKERESREAASTPGTGERLLSGHPKKGLDNRAQIMYKEHLIRGLTSDDCGDVEPQQVAAFPARTTPYQLALSRRAKSIDLPDAAAVAAGL